VPDKVRLLSPVRCGDGEGRKGRERRRGGGGGGGRAFTLLFLSPLPTVSRRYVYAQSIFFISACVRR
jgi:hypothetical protein